MIFSPTPIPGAFIVDLELKSDDRGFFARAFCAAEFEAHALDPTVSQCNMSYNHRRGTLRGLHYETYQRDEVLSLPARRRLRRHRRYAAGLAHFP